MPYFKNEEGAKGYVSDEKAMARLEEEGYVRLEGRELLGRIFIEACKGWGVPALVAVGTYHFTGEFMISLLLFVFVQEMLSIFGVSLTS